MRQAVAQGQPSKKEDMGTRSITKIACVWKRDAHVNSRWCSTHARHVSTQQAIFVLACSCCSTISERKQRLLVVYKRPEKGQENTCRHISSRVKIRHIQVNICKVLQFAALQNLFETCNEHWILSLFERDKKRAGMESPWSNFYMYIRLTGKKFGTGKSLWLCSHRTVPIWFRFRTGPDRTGLFFPLRQLLDGGYLSVSLPWTTIYIFRPY